MQVGVQITTIYHPHLFSRAAVMDHNGVGGRLCQQMRLFLGESGAQRQPRGGACVYGENYMKKTMWRDRRTRENSICGEDRAVVVDIWTEVDL